MKSTLKCILLSLLLCITGCKEKNDAIDNIDITETTPITYESTTAEKESTSGNIIETTTITINDEQRGYGSISYRISADEDKARLGVDKKLVIISPGALAARLEPSVVSRLNEVLVTDYGCDFVVEFVDYRCETQAGGYTYAEALCDTRSMGQQADIIISGATGWSNYYTNLIDNGLLMDITDYLAGEEEGKKLYAALSKTAWKGVTREGKIYGCDSAMNIYGSYKLVCNKQVAEELGLEVEEGFSFYDIEEMLRSIEGDIPKNVIGIAVNGLLSEMLGYYDMSGMEYIQHGVYAKKKSNGEWEAFNPLLDEEFVKLCRTIREYKEKGWITFTGKKTIESAISMQDGDFLFYYDSFVPGIINMAVDDKMVLTDYSNAIYEVVTGGEWGFLKGLRECNVTGIASWSENKDEALKLLTLMQTEEEIVNLLMWGVEGEDYRYLYREIVKSSESATDGGVEKDAYMVNQLLAYPQLIEPDNRAEYYKEIVKEYGENPFMQYEITDDEYRAAINDYANKELISICTKYYSGLLEGNYEDVDETISEVVKLQQAAGIDDLINAINKMFEEARNE